MSNKRRKKVLIFVILTAISVLTIYSIVKQYKYPSMNEIINETKISFPTEADLIFYKRIISYNSDTIIIKFRIDRNTWNDFIKLDIFKNSRKDLSNNNAFSSTESNNKNWNPAEVKKSISGIHHIDVKKNKKIVTYLFDIQSDLWVDCYFEINQNYF